MTFGYNIDGLDFRHQCSPSFSWLQFIGLMITCCCDVSSSKKVTKSRVSWLHTSLWITPDRSIIDWESDSKLTFVWHILFMGSWFFWEYIIWLVIETGYDVFHCFPIWGLSYIQRRLCRNFCSNFCYLTHIVAISWVSKILMYY